MFLLRLSLINILIISNTWGFLEDPSEVFSQCSALVKEDDNDVRKLGLADYINNNLECKIEDVVPTSDQLKRFESGLKNIKRHSLDAELSKRFQDFSLSQTALSYWILKKRYYNFKAHTAVSDICKLNGSCNHQQRILLQALLKNSKGLIESVQKVSSSDITQNLFKQFNPLARDMNKICKEAHSRYFENEKKYSCVPLPDIKMKNGKIESMTPARKISYGECHELVRVKVQVRQRIRRESLNKMREAYYYFTQAPHAEVLITENMRKRFPFPTEKTIDDQCFKGKTGLYSDVQTYHIRQNVESLKKSLEQGLKDELSSAKNVSKYIKEKIKTNPLQAAHILNYTQDDALAELMCSYIRSINKSEYGWHIFEKVSMTIAGAAATVLAFYSGGYSLALFTTLAVSSGAGVTSMQLKENRLRAEREMATKSAALTGEDLVRSINSLNHLDQEITVTNRIKKMTIVFTAMDAISFGGGSKVIMKALNKSLIGTKFFRMNATAKDLASLARKSKSAIKLLRTFINKGLFRLPILRKLTNNRLVRLALRLKTVRDTYVHLSDEEIVQKIRYEDSTNSIITKSLDDTELELLKM